MPVGPLAPWMRRRLRRMARACRGDANVPLRARMILMLAADPCVSEVAARLSVEPDTVRDWRDRFLAGGTTALRDAPRPGPARRISDVTRCELVSMACNRPSSYGVEHRRTWTFDALHEAYRRLHPEVEISRTSVLRVLTNAELRPHRMQGWMHSQDPDFRAKATRICSLYLSPPAGVVLCVDEKTGMQALKRKNPTKWAGLGHPGKWEYEYRRMGTRTLFAAFNTRDGRVVAEISRERKARDLLRFMDRVAAAYPCGPVQRDLGQPEHPHGRPGRALDGVQQAPRRQVPLPLHAAARVLAQPGGAVLQPRAASRAAARELRLGRRDGSRGSLVRRPLE